MGQSALQEPPDSHKLEMNESSKRNVQQLQIFIKLFFK